METAEKLRESRSRHLLHSSEVAVKQLRAFKKVLPVTPKKSVSSGAPQKKTNSASRRRQS